MPAYSLEALNAQDQTRNGVTVPRLIVLAGLLPLIQLSQLNQFVR